MRRGFSLLEVLVATAILAIVFTYVSGSFIQGGMLLSQSPRLTQASLLLRGAILDVEEEYRQDGFPSNDVTSRRCELPRDTDEQFECDYDLEKLDLDTGQLGEMAAKALEQIMGQAGDKGSLLQAFGVLSFLFVAGDIPISPLCPATANQFLTMCYQNPAMALQSIERNIMGMVNFFPTIISQAAEQTRKLRIRIRHKAFGEEPILEIETFIISIPEEVEALGKEGAIPEGASPTPPAPPRNP